LREFGVAGRDVVDVRGVHGPSVAHVGGVLRGHCAIRARNGQSRCGTGGQGPGREAGCYTGAGRMAPGRVWLVTYQQGDDDDLTPADRRSAACQTRPSSSQRRTPPPTASSAETPPISATAWSGPGR